MENNTIYLDVTSPPLWSRIIYIAIIVIIMVIALVGNGVIIVVEQFNKSKSSTDWLVFFMSLYDWIIAACSIPFYIIIYSEIWTTAGSTVLCRINGYTEATMSYASTLLLSVTAIDRYIKTCRPHSVGVTPSRSKYICIAVSAVTMVMGLPILFSNQFDKVYICVSTTSGGLKVAIRGMMYTVQVTFILMFGIVIACYSKIAYTIRTKLHRARFPRQVIETTLSSQRNTCLTTLPAERKSTKSNQVGPSSQEEPNPGGNTFVNTECIKRIQGKAKSATEQKQGPSNNSKNNNLPRCAMQNLTSVEHLSNHDVHSSKKNKNVRSFLQLKDKKINTTTIIMFAVTIVFMVSWIPAWVVGSIWPKNVAKSLTGNVLIMFARRAFLINACTNPLFFIGMSSTFRTKTKKGIMKIWAFLRNNTNA